MPEKNQYTEELRNMSSGKLLKIRCGDYSLRFCNIDRDTWFIFKDICVILNHPGKDNCTTYTGSLSLANVMKMRTDDVSISFNEIKYPTDESNGYTVSAIEPQKVATTFINMKGIAEFFNRIDRPYVTSEGFKYIMPMIRQADMLCTDSLKMGANSTVDINLESATNVALKNKTDLSATNIAQIDDTPLTREELALFYSHLMNEFTAQAKALTEQTKIVASAINKIDSLASSLSNVSNARTSAVSVISKDLNNKDEVDASTAARWANEVELKISDLAEQSGKSADDIYRNLYSLLNNKYNADVYKIANITDREIVDNKKCLRALSLNTNLCNLTTKCLQDICKVKTASVSAKKTMNETIKSLPAEVRKLVLTYSKRTNTTVMNSASVLYNRISRIANIDLNRKAKEYAESIGYSNCSKGYYISKNPDLMAILERIVND